MAELKENMPSDYLSSRIVSDITYPLDLENNSLTNKIISMIKEFNVSTATTTLNRYEEQYALPQNPSITIEERRSRVKAKMRSSGVVNKAMIKKVIDSWANGSCTVTEDFANYSFTVKFDDYGGVPSNLSDVKKAVEEIKPAHLNVFYDFKYMTWDKLDQRNLTWDELDQKNLVWDVFETGIW